MKPVEAMVRAWEFVPRLVPLMIIVGVFNLISGGILLGVIGVNPDADKIAEVAGLVVGMLIVMMLAWGYLEGGIFAALCSNIKTGDFSLNAFPADGAKFFLRLFILSVVSGVAVILILAVGAFITGLIVSLGNNQNVFFNLIGGIIMALAFLVMTIVSIGLYMSRFIAISQDNGPVVALKGAFYLFRDYFWRFLLLSVFVFGIFLITSAVVNLIGALLGRGIGIGGLLAVINLILTSSVNATVYLYTSTVIMVMILSLIVPAEAVSSGEKSNGE